MAVSGYPTHQALQRPAQEQSKRPTHRRRYHLLSPSNCTDRTGLPSAPVQHSTSVWQVGVLFAVLLTSALHDVASLLCGSSSPIPSPSSFAHGLELVPSAKASHLPSKPPSGPPRANRPTLPPKAKPTLPPFSPTDPSPKPPPSPNTQHGGKPKLPPSRKPPSFLKSPPPPKTKTGIDYTVPTPGPGPIRFLGGPVMVGEIRVYLIYYGNWTRKPVPAFHNFVHSLSNRSTTPKTGVPTAYDWWRLTTAYKSRSGQNPGEVKLAGFTFDSYSQGQDLTNAVDQVVANALQRKWLATDTNGVYMVLPSADVVETPGDGFCAGTYPFTSPNPIGYCGWHDKYIASGGKYIKFAFIGNANQCPARCGQRHGYKTTPNGNLGIDAMVNVLAHELSEAVTDPDPSTPAWLADTGDENADLCNRIFGNMLVAKDSVTGEPLFAYNMVGQGGMLWLVQQNWDLTTQSCRMGPAKPPPPPPPILPPPKTKAPPPGKKLG